MSNGIAAKESSNSTSMQIGRYYFLVGISKAPLCTPSVLVPCCHLNLKLCDVDGEKGEEHLCQSFLEAIFRKIPYFEMDMS